MCPAGDERRVRHGDVARLPHEVARPRHALVRAVEGVLVGVGLGLRLGLHLRLVETELVVAQLVLDRLVAARFGSTVLDSVSHSLFPCP